ncbi:MAG: hypothetical protein SW833_10495 [Cyanobacteriota bacterium]|nr:hypothetical protein [Cyanobacteriota bacterium]
MVKNRQSNSKIIVMAIASSPSRPRSPFFIAEHFRATPQLPKPQTR